MQQSFRERNAGRLVVFVVFLALLLDVMLMTSVDPILPSMLQHISNTKLVAFGGSNNGHNASMFGNEPARKGPGVENMTYMDQAGKVGILVAAKPFAEMLLNVPVGYLVDRIGHSVPMYTGCFFSFCATIGFAYSPSVQWLLLTRLLQALGSSLAVVSSLSFLATVFTDEEARSRATATAFAGIPIGIALGYPFGSLFYQFLSPQAPFLVLAGLSLLNGLLLPVVVLPEKRESEKTSCMSMCRMLADKYVSLGLLCCLLQHAAIGVFLAIGPAWMLDSLAAQQWNIGVVLGIAVLFHVASQQVTARCSLYFGRWFFVWIGMVLTGVGFAIYPLCRSVWHVVGPEIVVRIGHGAFLCVLSPLLARIADTHYDGNYGAIFGLYTAAYNCGLSVGPVVGGLLAARFSFEEIMTTSAALLVVSSLAGVALRGQDGPDKNGLLCKETSNYGSIDPDRRSLLDDEIRHRTSSLSSCC